MKRKRIIFIGIVVAAVGTLLGNFVWSQGSDLSPLSGLTKLRTLTLYNGYLMTDLSPLSQLTNLQTLTIYGHIDDLDYSPVSHVPNLILG